MPKYKYCRECGNKFNDEKNMIITEGLLFCSNECKRTFIERLSDELYIQPQIDEDDIEKLRNDMELEKKVSYESGYEEGYLAGFLDSDRKQEICPICCEREINSVHHILPRKFGGITNFNNIICLCNKCHDVVEIETYELLKKNKFVSINDLRRYILHGFPILSSKNNNSFEKLISTNVDERTHCR